MPVLRSLLLATDFRRSSEEAAGAVIRLAQTFGARVTVLHVREEFLTWPVTPFENQDRLTARLHAERVDLAEFIVRAGPPVDLILRVARDVDPDLLVIGTGEKVRDGQLALGPIAEAVLEGASVPVLAVNPYGPPLGFQTILCPVDGSAASRRGLHDAIPLARAFGGRLIVLSVVPEVSWLAAAVETGQLEGAKQEHERKWVREFEEVLAGTSFDGATWQKEVRHGVPHDQILAAARDHTADLIVMGATGRTGIVRALLGSVTRRMLRQLPCSVLVVKDRTAFEDQLLLDLEVIARHVAEGRARLAAGAAAEAAGQFRQALALDPYHPAALEGLAAACERLGQPETAQRYRSRAERVRQRATT